MNETNETHFVNNILETMKGEEKFKYYPQLTKRSLMQLVKDSKRQNDFDDVSSIDQVLYDECNESSDGILSPIGYIDNQDVLDYCCYNNNETINKGLSSIIEDTEPYSEEYTYEDKKDEYDYDVRDESDDSSNFLDVIGNGELTKRVIKEADTDIYPEKGDIVKINLMGKIENTDIIISEKKNYEYQIGKNSNSYSFCNIPVGYQHSFHHHKNYLHNNHEIQQKDRLIQGLEISIPLMKVGEIAEIHVNYRYAYGDFGKRNSNCNLMSVPPKTNLKYIVALLECYKPIEIKNELQQQPKHHINNNLRQPIQSILKSNRQKPSTNLFNDNENGNDEFENNYIQAIYEKNVINPAHRSYYKMKQVKFN